MPDECDGASLRALRFDTIALVAGGALTALIGAGLLAQYLGMSREETVAQVVLSVAAALVNSVAVLALTHGARAEMVKRVRTARSPDDAHAAWTSVVSYPGVVVRRAVPGTAVLILALGVFAVVNVDAPLWALAPIVVGGELVGLSAIALATFGLELSLRPALARVGRLLPPDFEPDRRTWSVRAKALGPLPLFALAGAIAVGAFSFESNEGALRLAIAFGIAIPIVALVAVMFLVVTRWALDPIGDLTAAARRARDGDLGATVPVVTADELGTLSASFNQMLEGLREREALRDAVLEREDELRASRARIVAASDAERRRVERNIHDGAQQQLVSLALKVKMLEARVGDEAELRSAVAEIGERLKAALSDLRELARGLHPSVLTTDGLGPALEQLASRASLPVSVSAPNERFGEAIESTAYFVASEGLANVAKYAEASRAEIEVERRNGSLFVRITDDGVGGAHAEAGSGLLGLADRVAALDGEFSVSSPAGRGTTIMVRFPLR